MSKLEGDELTEAIKEEMKLRRKELNQEISFQDVINFRTPELVGEYVGKCIQWMKCQEETFKIASNYIDNPPSKKSVDKKKPTTYKVTRQDRGVAVDLIVEIHRKYGLVAETLFVAVSTLDRYMGVRKIRLAKAKEIEAVAIA